MTSAKVQISSSHICFIDPKLDFFAFQDMRFICSPKSYELMSKTFKENRFDSKAYYDNC